MANIKIATKYPLYDGIPITFRAPCGSADIDGLVIGSQAFTLCDANGKTYLKKDGLFLRGAYVRVILDTARGLAYLQGVGGASATDSVVGDVKQTMVANQSPEWLYCDGSAVNKDMYGELHSVMRYNTDWRRVPMYGTYTAVRPLPVSGQWAFIDVFQNTQLNGKTAVLYDANTDTCTEISCPTINTSVRYGIFGLTHDGEKYILGVSEDDNDSVLPKIHLFTSTDLVTWADSYQFQSAAAGYQPYDLTCDGVSVLVAVCYYSGRFDTYVYAVSKALTSNTIRLSSQYDAQKYFRTYPGGYWRLQTDGETNAYAYKPGTTEVAVNPTIATTWGGLAFFSDRYWVCAPLVSGTTMNRIDVFDMKSMTFSYASLHGAIEAQKQTYLHGMEYNANDNMWSMYFSVNTSDYYIGRISANANPAVISNYTFEPLDALPERIHYGQMHPDRSQMDSELYLRDPNRKYLPVGDDGMYSYINVGRCGKKIAISDVVRIDDSLYRPLHGILLYGKSTQNGTPSPTSPVPITSVGNTTVTSVGKNLAGAATALNNGMTSTKIGTYNAAYSSEVVLNGTSGGAHSWTVIKDVFLPKGTYTASVKGLNVIDATSDRMYIFNYKTSAVIINNIKDSTPRTFTINEDMNVRCEFVFGAGSTYNNKTVYIQIERGNTATEYVPHQRSTQTFATPNGLNGIPVSSGGNYVDDNGQQWVCDEIDYERGVYIQRICKLILDGNTPLGNYRSEDNAGNYIGACLNGVPNAHASYYHDSLCSFLVDGTASTQGYYPNTFMCHPTSNAFIMRSEINGVTDVNKLNAWLASNPQEVQYVMAEPIETAISSDIDLVTFKGTTTVYNDANAGMKITYVTGGTDDET